MTSRKPLTRREFGFLILRQDCLCGCGCGRKLDFSRPKLVTDEHLVPIFSALDGADPNELDNRALWLTVCSVAKTSAEAPGRAKVRRIEQGKTQADRRDRAKAEGRHRKMGGKPWPKHGERKMQSRPFQYAKDRT